jgi:hypothetical protein
MTFRIDRITFNTSEDNQLFGSVSCSFKGYEGRGEYANLCAMPGGLYFLPPGISFEYLMLVPGFEIPAGADRQTASRCFAKALHELGWGPEVDQNGNVVDSETFQWVPAWR